MREIRTARGAELRTSNEIASVLPWLHQQALRGATGGTVLKALCERLVAGGLDIQRAVVGSLVFHPQYDAINYTWTPDIVTTECHPIRRQEILQSPTPFFHLHSTGVPELRQRLDATNASLPFALFLNVSEISASRITSPSFNRSAPRRIRRFGRISRAAPRCMKGSLALSAPRAPAASPRTR